MLLTYRIEGDMLLTTDQPSEPKEETLNSISRPQASSFCSMGTHPHTSGLLRI